MGFRSLLGEIVCKTVISCVLSAFLSFPLFAHPQSWQHIMEMYSVLPFAIDSNGNVVDENLDIRRWLEKITKDLIDDYNRVEIADYGGKTFYSYLNEEFGFNLSFGNHRILFHWCFNANPWNEALNSYVIGQRWENNKIQRFKKTLIDEQKRRNSIANKETEMVFGFSSGGIEARWANSILAIVYDVHLLGDYTNADNRNFKGVTVPSKVAADIINSIRRIDASKASYKIIDSIRVTITEYQSDQHLLAEKLIKILQKDMPKFLLTANGGTLKRRFISRGFKLK